MLYLKGLEQQAFKCTLFPSHIKLLEFIIFLSLNDLSARVVPDRVFLSQEAALCPRSHREFPPGSLHMQASGKILPWFQSALLQAGNHLLIGKEDARWLV